MMDSLMGGLFSVQDGGVPKPNIGLAATGFIVAKPEIVLKTYLLSTWLFLMGNELPMETTETFPHIQDDSVTFLITRALCHVTHEFWKRDKKAQIV